VICRVMGGGTHVSVETVKAVEEFLGIFGGVWCRNWRLQNETGWLS
jgi:hypothetical protein